MVQIVPDPRPGVSVERYAVQRVVGARPRFYRFKRRGGAIQLAAVTHVDVSSYGEVWLVHAARSGRVLRHLLPPGDHPKWLSLAFKAAIDLDKVPEGSEW